MTPDRQIPESVLQMLANARPEQIAKLLRDIQKSEPRHA
ncbi:hypothetical protein LOM8899_01205 [Flavimaricola marinus]|uniref:Uncharacterized protein n=1 Tax=Flavimaricola marinus TaxID=1819565 RepID=A0A238LBZ0_9RHOB|nr:hypothetical protein LOM8899_01205 [Flavimaricola marinus]